MWCNDARFECAVVAHRHHVASGGKQVQLKPYEDILPHNRLAAESGATACGAADNRDRRIRTLRFQRKIHQSLTVLVPSK
jgi:hypothetical protein